jgi:D-lyxose ketol-isomerase
MKRSEINGIEKKALSFMAKYNWKLPQWALWTREEWLEHKKESTNVIDHNLGWDITDFGSGNFSKRGLFLFTMRNGLAGTKSRPYAEKIMLVEEEQETPFHFHWHKMEDIINRGGGVLLFNIYASTENDELSDKDLVVHIDDIPLKIKAGEQIALKPGQSLTLEQRVYHRFYGARGEGTVLVGEVSQVNDDSRDNRFYETIGRFPQIEEDEPILYPLQGDLSLLLGEEK